MIEVNVIIDGIFNDAAEISVLDEMTIIDLMNV